MTNYHFLTGKPLVTHLSHHPGPDPKKTFLSWGPLCGAPTTREGLACSPSIEEVDCPECVAILWSGQWTGFLGKHQDSPRSQAELPLSEASESGEQ